MPHDDLKTHDLFEGVDAEGVGMCAVCGGIVVGLIGPGLIGASGIGSTLGCAAFGAVSGGVIYTVAPVVAGLCEVVGNMVGGLIDVIRRKRTRKRNRDLWRDTSTKSSSRPVTKKQQMQINKQMKLQEYLRAVAMNDRANSHYGYYMGPSAETMDRAKERWEEDRRMRGKRLRERKKWRKIDNSKYDAKIDKICAKFHRTSNTH